MVEVRSLRRRTLFDGSTMRVESIVTDARTHSLLLVDIQNDFLPGGALAVPDGDAVIPVANRLMPHFHTVIATQDFHPDDHRSFADMHEGQLIGDVIKLDGLEQILWPRHCVQGTDGADLSDKLESMHIDQVVTKGCDHEIDSYSGFYDNGKRKQTGLADLLRGKEIADVWILGLATDYCVMATALDAVAAGFRTHLIEDGVRAVDINAHDGKRAIDRMREAGVEVVSSDEVLRRFPTLIRD